MSKFEYRVIPAPLRGSKSRGVRSTSDRFAFALQEIMNEQAEDGWQYMRTDTLPCEERQGLTRRNTVYQNMLVFAREIADEQDAVEPLAAAIDNEGETVPSEPADYGADVDTDASDEPLPEPSDTTEKPEKPRLGGVVRAD